MLKLNERIEKYLIEKYTEIEFSNSLPSKIGSWKLNYDEMAETINWENGNNTLTTAWYKDKIFVNYIIGDDEPVDDSVKLKMSMDLNKDNVVYVKTVTKLLKDFEKEIKTNK